jgi:hypothetical protein
MGNVVMEGLDKDNDDDKDDDDKDDAEEVAEDDDDEDAAAAAAAAPGSKSASIMMTLAIIPDPRLSNDPFLCEDPDPDPDPEDIALAGLDGETDRIFAALIGLLIPLKAPALL